MGVWAILGFLVAPFHQIEKTNQRGFNELTMWVSTFLVRKSTFWDSIVITGIDFQIVWEFAFTSWRTVIFIVQFFACVRVGFRTSNLPSDVMRKVAVHSIFAVTSEIMDARILVSFNMQLFIFAIIANRSCAFFNGEILLSTETLNAIEFSFEFFKSDEVFVVHELQSTMIYNIYSKSMWDYYQGFRIGSI